jgi:hypothetical protein
MLCSLVRCHVQYVLYFVLINSAVTCWVRHLNFTQYSVVSAVSRSYLQFLLC